ncbi:MAG: ABC transporter ATP-binding protein [Gammaproteobacteria bacterium RIFCSPHIGHO2_12_FULL_45_9]|nr:MAG: ABC transporter ATP-binding protein [Gammaproteobacteria bacterium RIFCSPHIGHO2_12_FULL_45_9]
MVFCRETRPIFDGITLSIPRGKITAIMGPSGTGKTTLLKLIGGQLRPESGTILVDDQNVHQLVPKQLYQLRRSMGVLFQEGGLFTDLNVFENVAFPLREHTRLPEDMLRDLVLMHLEAVGLRGAASLRIDQLSGGMSRRVALARAIILGPQLMMYDEPFSGQDPIGRGVLLRLIKELNDALNMTSVVVSHDVHEAAQLADYVVIIFQGKIIGAGTPDEVIHHPSAQVQQFVQGLADGPVTFHYPANNYKEELLGDRAN